MNNQKPQKPNKLVIKKQVLKEISEDDLKGVIGGNMPGCKVTCEWSREAEAVE